jgi:hypothetical protein
MRIDDPLDAVKKLREADERERNPVTQRLARLASELIPGAGSILDFIDTHREENCDLLIQTLEDLLRGLLARFDKLDARHREFLQNDFSSLLMDGLKKAETLRSKERVERVARILASAANEGPSLPPDDTEEMMRVAVELSDLEVKVLGVLVASQANTGKLKNMPKSSEVTLGWDPDPIPELDRATLFSACAKLQSFGLVAAVAPVRSSSTNIGLREISTEYPIFAVLKKGFDFVRYADSISGAQHRGI